MATFQMVPFKDALENSSIIDAFASLLQLSYSKLIFVSFNLLVYVETQNAKGEYVHPKMFFTMTLKYHISVEPMFPTSFYQSQSFLCL